ncbi:MAG: hypothetical protein ACK5YR_24660 [Pirellula sp.]|jgi:hypothetical protein
MKRISDPETVCRNMATSLAGGTLLCDLSTKGCKMMKTHGAFLRLVHFWHFIVVFDFCLASDCLGLQSTQGVEQITNETVRNLSIDLEILSIRGSSGYGNDTVNDDGIEHLRRFPKLKI